MKSFYELKDLPLQKGGKIIHFSQDEYGRVLVIDDGNQRVLNFDSLFEQSCMQISGSYQLVHQYTQFMTLVLAFIDPEHITLFGLGGGSLLRTFHHVLPKCHFKVVELREVIVDIAREYFSLPVDQRVSITVNDAFREISQIKSCTSDIILSDMYDAYQMEPEQVQSDFLKECSRVLRHNGWLVLNLHHIPGERAEFFDMLSDIFPAIIISATSENTILFACNADPEQINLNLSALDAIEKQLQQRLKQLLSRLQPINFHFNW